MQRLEKPGQATSSLFIKSHRVVWLYALTLFLVNLIVIAKLFGVEYLAYTGSVEGTFIAIPRVMVAHPGQWTWWPFWNGGLPFELTYLPFEHWTVAAFTALSGFSAARSLHIVSALVYAIGPVTAFWMSWTVSRKPLGSFLASLAYSCLSLSTLFVPEISFDSGGAFTPRRLYVLVFYGASPEVFALALLPIPVACLWLSIHTEEAKWKVFAGITAGAVALTNSFGIMLLTLASLCLILVYRTTPWWRGPLTLCSIGTLTYCWVSPWLSPRFIQAVRENSSTSGGDFRYTSTSYIALVLTIVGFLICWLLLRRSRIELHLQFLWLFAMLPTTMVVLWYTSRIAVVPQPSRYHLETDLLLMLAFMLTLGSIFARVPRRAQSAAVTVLLIGCAVQMYSSQRYAHHLIKAVDKTSLSEYKIALWLADHKPKARSFLPGSTSYLFNAFTDNQQLLGGHDQHTLNGFLLVVSYILYAGTNAADVDTKTSLFWLKAFGVRAVSMSGPGSTAAYQEKIFSHPHKFEGLPVLWSDHGDVIYEVPGSSESLAHVIPRSAVVSKVPVHGLDTAPAEAFVAALADPRYATATFEWRNMSEANIRTDVGPGQVISVQESYTPGWEAWAGGQQLQVRGDAIGQIVIEPIQEGPTQIILKYTGGPTQLLTRTLSIVAMLCTFWYWFRRRQILIATTI